MKKSIIYSSLVFSALLAGCSTPLEKEKSKSATSEIEVHGKTMNSDSKETTVKGTLEVKEGSPSVMVLHSTNMTEEIHWDSPEQIELNGQTYKIVK